MPIDVEENKNLRQDLIELAELLRFRARIGQLDANDNGLNSMAEEFKNKEDVIKQTQDEIKQKDVVFDSDHKFEKKLRSDSNDLYDMLKRLEVMKNNVKTKQELLEMVELLRFGVKLSQWDANDKGFKSFALEFEKHEKKINEIKEQIKQMTTNNDLKHKFEHQLNGLAKELKQLIMNFENQKNQKNHK